MAFETQILNSKNQRIVLNDREEWTAKKHEAEIKNALGLEVSITTLYAIMQKVVEQKFFQIAPADFMPVRVGQNAWASNILQFREFQLSGDFETGIVNQANGAGRLAQADAGYDSISVPVLNWGKEITWNIFELNQASKAGNWDVVTGKERSRKRNWDLGIQKIAFVGTNDGINRGLLNQSAVTANTTLITQSIKSMSATQFQTLLAGLIEAYRANAARTAMPTHFVLPEGDFNGLANSVDETYPLKSRLERLLEALRLITMNPNFKILPCAYADQTNNATISGLNKNVYTLLNYDEDSLSMDIPVDYTNTMANTLNGVTYQNAAVGQFSVPFLKRPKEMIYFTF